MHTYYTPKTIKIQVELVNFTFFVNYDNYLCQHRYVNYCNHIRIIIYQFQLFSQILGFVRVIRN